MQHNGLSENIGFTGRGAHQLAASQRSGSGRITAADLIESLDREDGPFGPRATWPPLLKQMITLILGSSQPMQLFWGRERVLFYNDAYIPILATRHPDAMGSPMRAVFPEVWEDRMQPMIEQAFAGVSVQMDDFEVQLTRKGFPEEAHFSFSYTPVRDELGAVAGVLAPTFEITDRILESRKSEAMEDISSVIRDFTDPEDVLRHAARLVSETLGSGMAAFAEVNKKGNIAHFHQHWSEYGFGPIPPELHLDRLGPGVYEALHAGKIVGVEDHRGDARHAEVGVVTDAVGLRSLLIAPLFEHGALAGLVIVADDIHRRWLPHEGRLLKDCGLRVWMVHQRAVDRMRLEESEKHLSRMMQATPHLKWKLSNEGRVLFANERWSRFTGIPQEELADRWKEAIFEEDLHPLLMLWQAAKDSGSTYESEVRIRREDGAYRWFLLRGVPFSEDDGSRTWIGTCTDIHERVEAERTRAIATAELDHRVKNMMAVVRSIAQQTFRKESKSEGIYAAFVSRLEALSRSHDLLLDRNWSGATVQDIVQTVMDQCEIPHSSWSITGPEVQIDAGAVTTVAMGIYELTSNAKKFGALSVDRGRVDIRLSRWPRKPLSLEWKESGGPEVVQPTTSGFGTRLLKRAFASEFEGRVVLSYEPEGFHLRLTANSPDMVVEA